MVLSDVISFNFYICKYSFIIVVFWLLLTLFIGYIYTLYKSVVNVPYTGNFYIKILYRSGVFFQTTTPSRQSFILVLQEPPLSNIKKMQLISKFVHEGFILCNQSHHQDKILIWYCRNFL